jgi:hypothetical protein
VEENGRNLFKSLYQHFSGGTQETDVERSVSGGDNLIEVSSFRIILQAGHIQQRSFVAKFA